MMAWSILVMVVLYIVVWPCPNSAQEGKETEWAYNRTQETMAELRHHDLSHRTLQYISATDPYFDRTDSPIHLYWQLHSIVQHPRVSTIRFPCPFDFNLPFPPFPNLPSLFIMSDGAGAGSPWWRRFPWLKVTRVLGCTCGLVISKYNMDMGIKSASLWERRDEA